jgi:hypothetical protein
VNGQLFRPFTFFVLTAAGSSALLLPIFLFTPFTHSLIHQIYSKHFTIPVTLVGSFYPLTKLNQHSYEKNPVTHANLFFLLTMGGCQEYDDSPCGKSCIGSNGSNLQKQLKSRSYE